MQLQREGSSRPWLFEELLEMRASIEKKLPRQKARQKLRVWQGVWLLQDQSHEPSAFFCAAPPALSAPPGVVFQVGIAEQ